MYNKFDKENLQVMRRAIEAALEPLGDRFGMSFKVDGRISYTEKTFEAKLSCAIGDMDVKEETDFNLDCSRFGFSTSDYGRSFDYDGHSYKFIGFKRRAKKYPCVAVTTDNSGNAKRVCFTVGFMKNLLEHSKLKNKVETHE